MSRRFLGLGFVFVFFRGKEESLVGGSVLEYDGSLVVSFIVDGQSEVQKRGH